MNRWKSTGMIACMAMALSLSAVAKAQTPPPPPGGDQRQGPGGGGDRPDGPPPRGDRGGPDGGQGGPDGGGPGGDRQRGPRGGGDQMGGPGGGDRPAAGGQEFNRFNGYLSMVSQYSKIAADPETTGVAAVVSAADILRRKGPQDAIDYFTKLLPDVKNAAVQRTIKLQLVDLYKAAKQEDKALETLKSLITADAAPANSLMKQ